MALPLAGNFRKSFQFRNILADRRLTAAYRVVIIRLIILKQLNLKGTKQESSIASVAFIRVQILEFK